MNSFSKSMHISKWEIYFLDSSEISELNYKKEETKINPKYLTKKKVGMFALYISKLFLSLFFPGFAIL